GWAAGGGGWATAARPLSPSCAPTPDSFGSPRPACGKACRTTWTRYPDFRKEAPDDHRNRAVPSATAHRPRRLRRAFPPDCAGFPRGAGLDPQVLHLRRGRLARRRLPVAEPRRRRGLLRWAVAGGTPRALWYGPADQVFRNRLHHGQCGRGGAGPRRPRIVGARIREKLSPS